MGITNLVITYGGNTVLRREDLENIPEDAKYIFLNEDGSIREALFGERVSDRIEDIEKVNLDIVDFYENDYKGFLVHHFAILYMNGDIELLLLNVLNDTIVLHPESKSLRKEVKISWALSQFTNKIADSCMMNYRFSEKACLFTRENFLEIAEHIKPHLKDIKRYAASSKLLNKVDVNDSVKFGWSKELGIMFDFNDFSYDFYSETSVGARIPQFVAAIGRYNYSGANRNWELVIPEGVKHLLPAAMDGNFGTVVLPSTLETMGGRCFDTVYLKYLVLPDNLIVDSTISYEPTKGIVIMSENLIKLNFDAIVLGLISAADSYENHYEKFCTNSGAVLCLYAVVPDVKNYKTYIKEGIEKYLLNDKTCKMYRRKYGD